MDDIESLLAKYSDGTASEEEIRQLHHWYVGYRPDNPVAYSEEEQAEDRAAIWAKLRPNKSGAWFKLATAAVIFMALTVGFLTFRKKSVPDAVEPGRYQAILTLSNGSQVKLHGSRMPISEQGTTIATDTGAIAYSVGTSSAQNTLRTANGWYRVRLSDGTLAVLNAASSITYPVNFTGKTRNVAVAGEVYFEVAKDKHHPFIVDADHRVNIEVLGTHFNINAYPDEGEVKTTLLEGSIRLSSVGRSALLRPGQQGDEHLRVIPADTGAVVAWKNGDFSFGGHDLRAAMREIARWYQVDVRYDNIGAPELLPGGWISRSKNLSEVLQIMAATGKVHFKTEGRRITVTR